MSDPLNTPRFSLPLLAVAQAQKEVTHNEALTLIDALIQPVVEAGPVNDPPSAPAVGQCWVVGSAPTGAWTGRDARLAIWTGGGWRFVTPRPAMCMTRLTDGIRLHFDGLFWSPAPSVAAPVGGAIIDAEARAAIAALLSILGAHGLVIAA
ncbi:MAG TPA: DUF2793 domain-containing protein [Sphingomicrobium sp.]